MKQHALTLFELNAMVRGVIERCLDRAYWVQAEVSEVREVKGHCYLELIQKAPFSPTPVARASAKCWRNSWQRLKPKFEHATGQMLSSGMKVMLLVTANFHEAFGFSWIVEDIDPTYTLGDMARKRLEIIRQLKAEGVFDLQKELTIPRTVPCHECHGSGAAAGSSREKCPDCGGTGMRQTVHNTPLGRMMSQSTCSRCGGTGEIIKNPCKHCHGTGQESIRDTFDVTIPKGVDQGQRVRVSGKGNAGKHGGGTGDLYVYIYIKEHKFFKRQGNDVVVEVPITFVQAALGDTVEVPTIDGKVNIKIDPGIQSGKVLRVRNHGIPHLRGNGRGDELVRIKVLTPQKLSPKQKELLKQFDESCGTKENPEQKSFFDKMKNFFSNYGD